MRKKRETPRIALTLSFGEIYRLKSIMDHEIPQMDMDKDLYLKISDALERACKKI